MESRERMEKEVIKLIKAKENIEMQQRRKIM